MSAPRRKVLLVDQTPHLWGGQTVLRMAVAAYRDRGWRVTVLAPGSGDLERALETDHGRHVDFVRLDMPRFNAGRKTLVDIQRLLWLTLRFRRYRNLLAEQDLVHVNGPRLWLPVHRALSRDTGAPGLLLHVHLDHSGPEKKLLASILSSRPDAHALTVSPFVHRRLRAHPRLAEASNLVELENALFEDPPPFENRFDGRPLRTIAVPGRIGREKGQLVLLDIAPRFPDLEFLVIGAADPVGLPIEERLRREAPANVHLRGRVRSVPDALAHEGVQVALVPSEWDEPFGLVALETMASSCLTLVRRRGGLVDVAEATGARTFDTMDELIEGLRELQETNPGTLAIEAERQHAATCARFSPETWRRNLLTIAENAID